MKLRSALLAAGASALAFGALGAVEDGGWVAFEPAHDDFQPNVLDCSRWVEAPTGKHGFLAVQGEQFVFQDGAPARFWGAQVNSVTKEQVDYMVQRMRRQGINITRLHGLESLNDRNGKTSADYSESAWDRMDYLISKLGENGIYIILDTDYPLNYRFRPGDNIPGMPEGGPAPYSEFFEEKVASVLRQRMVEVLTHFNPYTKKRYCEDPTVALVEILNEDSLFWGEVPQRYHDQITGMFKAWLRNRRGEEAALSASWLPNRELLFQQQAEATPEKRALAQDQLRFMEGLEEEYWTGSREAMRKAGVKAPIAGTNWQGHGSPTTRVHMLGQSKVDYIDRHGYWDHPQGEGNLRWQIATAQFHNLPMIKDVKPDQDHLVYLESVPWSAGYDLAEVVLACRSKHKSTILFDCAKFGVYNWGSERQFDKVPNWPGFQDFGPPTEVGGWRLRADGCERPGGVRKPRTRQAESSFPTMDGAKATPEIFHSMKVEWFSQCQMAPFGGTGLMALVAIWLGDRNTARPERARRFER